MSATDAEPAPPFASGSVQGMSSLQLAKATLHKLAQARLEPTPENYSRTWAECGGTSSVNDGAVWVELTDALVRGLEQNGRHWTVARKRESVRRVLDGSRQPQRLRERLSQLMTSWQDDVPDAVVDPVPALTREPAQPVPPTWTALADTLNGALQSCLPAGDPAAPALQAALSTQSQRWNGQAVDDALVADVRATCVEAERVFVQRQRLFGELGRLVHALTDGLAELAEDGSWAQGQAEALRVRLGGSADSPLDVRGVRSAAALLEHTRSQQQRLRAERDRARAALRTLVESLAAEMQALGGHTERFDDELQRCTSDLEHADSREQLGSVLHQMLAASRSVQHEVADASARLASGRAQAEHLGDRVRELESELKRLSDEVSTDALTQVANRRGLAQAFELERARCGETGLLAVALIDVDNFKKLNDTLGHAAGDEALKALAAQVRTQLRPGDHVARFGGEEFVVLLPATVVDEACEVLTRLQRSLSMGLFMHEGRDVLVTFSAGVTAWRSGESLDAAIERADGALYEAKRTGKNRTCTA